MRMLCISWLVYWAKFWASWTPAVDWAQFWASWTPIVDWAQFWASWTQAVDWAQFWASWTPTVDWAQFWASWTPVVDWAQFWASWTPVVEGAAVSNFYVVRCNKLLRNAVSFVPDCTASYLVNGNVWTADEGGHCLEFCCFGHLCVGWTVEVENPGVSVDSSFLNTRASLQTVWAVLTCSTSALGGR